MPALLKLLPAGAQLAIAIALLSAIGGGYYAWRSGVFNKGIAYERAQQKERDDEASEVGRQGRNDVGRCYDAGGVWDVKVGICRR